MSKIGGLFKNKKFLMGVSICVAFIIVASSTLGIMLPSYFSWKDYFDAAMADREYQKYLLTLPLECKGITAELNDNVAYYDNGKADPQKSDFSVIAHFTEKGKEFDEILQPSGFDIDVPAGFATNGGAVKVTYVFTPEPEEVTSVDEDGEERVEVIEKDPVEFTAEVECSLDDVLPTGIALKNRPYRIYYSDDMAFDTDGLSATVAFNDGHTEEVYGEELSASKDKLVAGTEVATVTWSRGGTEMTFDAGITVVEKSKYSDGDIYALSQEGTFYIAEGAKTSEALPPIRATYFSGNRLLLNASNCTVRGNVQYASYTKTCILNVTLKTDASVFTKVIATVTTGVEAESMHATGSTTTETYNNATVVVPQKGSSVSAVLKVDALSKPDFYLRAAVKGDEPIALADVIKLTVRGNEVTVPSYIVIPAGNSLYDVALPGILLFEGDNAITIEFIGDESNKLMIDRLDLEAGYKGEFYPSTEKYLTYTATNNLRAEFETEFAKTWGTVGGLSYGHGLCSDGTYLYTVSTGYRNAGIGRPARVVKLNLETKTEVAVSAPLEEKMLEATAGITYYDNKIIIYYMDGRKMYVDVDKFTAGCTFQEYHGFDDFEGLEPEETTFDLGGEQGTTMTIKAPVFYDVYYNTAQQRFAVFVNDSIYDDNGEVITDNIKLGRICLFDKDKNLITEISVPSAASRRMTGSAEYIYVNYTADGRYSPVVEIYDWDGNHIGQQTIPVDTAFLGLNGVVLTSKTNVQGLAVINGDFYMTFLRFGQKPDGAASNIFGDSCCIFKVSMHGVSNRLNPDLTFSEYMEVCNTENVDPMLTAVPSLGALGKIDGPTNYTAGAVQHGEYLYLSEHIDSKATITKVKLEDYSMVCKSSATPALTGASGDVCRLFVKDDVLYVVGGNFVYSISLDKFEQGCELTLDEDMTALLTQNGKYPLIGATYNVRLDKYAVICQNGGDKICVLNGDGTVAVDLFDSTVKGYTTSSVCCDDNSFFVSYRVNNQKTIPIRQYSFDGTLVREFSPSTVEGFNPGGNGYNVQSIFMVNGTIHAAVCTWNNKAFYDWTLELDYFVFRKISSLGDYLNECAQDDVSPKLTAKATVGEYGAITGTTAYSSGGAQYGDYMYLATNESNKKGQVYKVKISDGSVVATSSQVTLPTTVTGGDNTRVFIKDDTLYMVAGEVFSISLDNFAAGCTLTKDEGMTSLLSQNGAYTLKSVAYNANVDKYAVIYQDGNGDSSTTYGLYVLNGDGSVAVDAFAHNLGGYKCSSVCADDEYFYVSYSNNGQASIPIEVFSWSGEQKFSLDTLGMTPNMVYFGVSSYNIQAIYFVNGELHAAVCTWAKDKIMFYDMTIEADYSVFN